MTSYSLIKIGNDYVVQVGGQCILKVASRRRAAQLIREAMDLLNAEAAAASRTERPEEPSLRRETPELP